MGTYSPPNGGGYPPLQIHPNHSNHPNLHPLASAQSPVGSGGETAVSLSHPHPIASSPYYGPQSGNQLQYPPYDEQPNGNGNLHHNGRSDQLQQSAPAPANAPAPTSGGGEPQSKKQRLPRACDLCSKRKVKCDTQKPRCRPCAEINADCTFIKEVKRRGPPNKAAEDHKKRQRTNPPDGGSLGFASAASSSMIDPSIPNSIGAASAALVSLSSKLNAESICPFSTLELFVDDFFTYIHPLCPFPHEPSFRASLRRREDIDNPRFLALLASMVGALVASFPRKPLLHLKAEQRQDHFPDSMSLVTKCYEVAIEARGVGYLNKELTIIDAVTSYFLCLAGAYTFQNQQARMYLAEAIEITRFVLSTERVMASNALNPGSLSLYSAPSPDFHPHVDYIRDEVTRRVFWILFVSTRSMQQFTSPAGDPPVFPPHSPKEPYPPFPTEVDDEYIYVDHIDPQPAGVLSKLVGYNLNIKVYSTVTPLVKMELAYGIDVLFDWDRQKRVLEECLHLVQQVLEGVPAELLLQPDRPSSGSAHHPYYPPTGDGLRTNGNDSQWLGASSESRRRLQYEIQKANIYASQLATRSHIVEKYLSLLDEYERVKAKSDGVRPHSSSGGLDSTIAESQTTVDYDQVDAVMKEREKIIQDLLFVLYSISEVNMEPNSGSFQNKIRQIATTLIDTPPNRKGPLAVEAEDALGQFLQVLVKLENFEDEELRHWADLRRYRERFAQAGGFVGQQ